MQYGREVTDLLTACGIKPVRTSLACPRQNGIAERWIESCRRERLDHVIVLNDGHLRRLMRDYLSSELPILLNFLSSLTSESVSSYRCERTIIDHSRIRFWRPMPRRLHRRM